MSQNYYTLLSQKHRVQICFEGYIYNYNSRRNSTKYYRCATDKVCRGRGSLHSNNQFSVTGEHTTHGRDDEGIKRKIAANLLRSSTQVKEDISNELDLQNINLTIPQITTGTTKAKDKYIDDEEDDSDSDFENSNYSDSPESSMDFSDFDSQFCAYEPNYENLSRCFICKDFVHENYSNIFLNAENADLSETLMKLLDLSGKKIQNFFNESIFYCESCKKLLEGVDKMQSLLIEIHEEIGKAKEFISRKIENNYSDFCENYKYENQRKKSKVKVEGENDKFALVFLPPESELLLSEPNSKKCTVPGCEKEFENTLARNIHFSSAHLLCKEEERNKEDLEHLFTTKLLCPYCTSYFHKKQQISLEEHIFRMHFNDVPKLSCDICGKICYLTNNLETHLISHAKCGEHECVVHFCSKVFDGREELKNHVAQTHDSDGPQRLTCQACSKSFNQAKLYSRHIESHSIPPDPVCKIAQKCSECSCRFYSTKLLSLHVLKEHRKDPTPYKCTTCSSSFKKKGQLRDHVRNSHTVRKMKKKDEFIYCSECPHLKFKMQETFQVHVKRVHEGNSEPYECRFCPLKFCSKIKWGQHEEMKHLGPGLLCTYCGKQFSIFRQRPFESHILASHPQAERLLCSICGKVSVVPDMHQRHLQLHKKHESMNPHSFYCVLCSRKKECIKDFNSIEQLREHVNERHSVKPKRKRGKRNIKYNMKKKRETPEGGKKKSRSRKKHVETPPPSSNETNKKNNETVPNHVPQTPLFNLGSQKYIEQHEMEIAPNDGVLNMSMQNNQIQDYYHNVLNTPRNEIHHYSNLGFPYIPNNSNNYSLYR